MEVGTQTFPSHNSGLTNKALGAEEKAEPGAVLRLQRRKLVS